MIFLNVLLYQNFINEYTNDFNKGLVVKYDNKCLEIKENIHGFIFLRQILINTYFIFTYAHTIVNIH